MCFSWKKKLFFSIFFLVFCLLFGALARPARLTSPRAPIGPILIQSGGGRRESFTPPAGTILQDILERSRNLLIRFNSFVAFIMYHVATRRSRICSDNRSKDGAHACFFSCAHCKQRSISRLYGGNSSEQRPRTIATLTEMDWLLRVCGTLCACAYMYKLGVNKMKHFNHLKK